MGIINSTPDSFYSGSRHTDSSDICQVAGQMVRDGVDVFDVGGYSSRSGAEEVTPEEEFQRVARVLEVLKKSFPEKLVSLDTFRASVARRCHEEFGIDIINDISGGDADPEMWDYVAEAHLPYILMHMRGTPQTMQQMTDYPEGVVAAVIKDMAFKAAALRQKGVGDIILDPGFGFAKTLEQNYELFGALPLFKDMGMPVLAGMSRKSMLYRLLGITPDEALEATVAAHTAALMLGADIIRVHDVKAAAQAAAIIYKLQHPADHA